MGLLFGGSSILTDIYNIKEVNLFGRSYLYIQILFNQYNHG